MSIIVSTSKTDNAYVLMLFKVAIPALYISFSLFFLADVANQKIGLLRMQSPEETESFSQSAGRTEFVNQSINDHNDEDKVTYDY